ncbi:hypothetical protein CK203_058922 [Vitis vinifera]|uniref:Retrovirus-related Pol polyprotein from transposon TNT 1-94 n=1 Tax=Vitis vinifera TaxID=29760 RepID=A0A438FS80_VITVI|nr:hypothetical protein CK203_058922 [Vitis vinifera]
MMVEARVGRNLHENKEHGRTVKRGGCREKSEDGTGERHVREFGVEKKKKAWKWGELQSRKLAQLSLLSKQCIQPARDQFLIKLRPDFEIAQSNLMNRHPVPSLDVCLNELLREEQRIVTQATMEHRANVSALVSVAYAAQGKIRVEICGLYQCFSCKDFGHIARDCPKKFCNYCKKQGHIISAYPIRPERSRDQVSGKIIAKGPKVGRLFPFHVSPSTIIPSFLLLSFACNVVGSGHKMWHRHLGHPNSNRFLALIETQFSANIKVLCSDSGGEYMSNELQDFLQSKGIISQRSCPSTPQQNVVAERKNPPS